MMTDDKSIAQRPEALSLPQQRYVETIEELCRTTGSARTSDLAMRLNVRMPSVSEAVTRLVAQGIANRNSRHTIELTPKGRLIADQLKQRHEALRLFMREVMVMDEARADEMACRIEHCVDKEFSDRLLMLAEFLEQKHPDLLTAIARHVKRRTVKADQEWNQFSI
jgi:DtxR family Mn-dependent transcriptional regulator